MLNRGARLTELLKQAQYKPLSVEHMVVVIYAGVNGFLDKIPVNRVTAFEAGVIPYVQANAPEIFESIKKESKINDDTDNKIKQVLGDFAKVRATVGIAELYIYLLCVSGAKQKPHQIIVFHINGLKAWVSRIL